MHSMHPFQTSTRELGSEGVLDSCLGHLWVVKDSKYRATAMILVRKPESLGSTNHTHNNIVLAPSLEL